MKLALRVMLGPLPLIASCSSSGVGAWQDAECSTANRTRLDFVSDTLVDLDALGAELQFRLVAACEAIAGVSDQAVSVVPSADATETLVATCSAARDALGVAMNAGVRVSVQRPECIVPTTDEACVAACLSRRTSTGAETGCSGLCDARALFRVTCTAARLMVSNATPTVQASFEAELVPIFDAAARTEVAIVGSSGLSDAIALAKPLESACDADYPQLQMFPELAIRLQAIFVASTQITGMLR